MKPPMSYCGGKQQLAPLIVSLLAEHEHYVEPYAGGLSVLLAKPPSTIETVNDTDEHGSNRTEVVWVNRMPHPALWVEAS